MTATSEATASPADPVVKKVLHADAKKAVEKTAAEPVKK
jgi:hypothetical protein